MPIALAALVFLALCPLAAAPAGATTLERLDLPQLVQRAHTIFVGTCLSSDETTLAGRPYRRFHFSVARTLKGDHLPRRTVHLPGGTHNGRTIRFVGMPQIAPDEEIVLFLTEADDLGYAWPVGLAQGKFTVLRQTGNALVRRDLQGASLVGAAKSGQALDGMGLEDFLNQVRRLQGGQPDARR